jgi:hypothetical protein
MNNVLRRLENLERNGHAAQSKTERHWTTKEDLDALYSHIYEGGPRPPSHLTAEEEHRLNAMYDRIVADLREAHPKSGACSK